MQYRGDWTHLHTTHDERPQSEDVAKFYPDVTVAAAEKAVSEEVCKLIKTGVSRDGR